MSNISPDELREDFTLLMRPADAPLPQSAQMPRDYLPLLVGTALILLAAFLWLQWRKHCSRPRPGERAEVIALRALQPWQSLEDEARYREAVAEISAISRRYVEGRFGLRAPTLTTEEFWVAQRSSRKIPAPHLPYFERFLSSIDAIKYAGNLPSRTLYGEFIENTVEFVRASASRGVRV
jgi:hypothetical protein